MYYKTYNNNNYYQYLEEYEHPPSSETKRLQFVPCATELLCVCIFRLHINSILIHVQTKIIALQQTCSQGVRGCKRIPLQWRNQDFFDREARPSHHRSYTSKEVLILLTNKNFCYNQCHLRTVYNCLFSAKRSIKRSGLALKY